VIKGLDKGARALEERKKRGGDIKGLIPFSSLMIIEGKPGKVRSITSPSKHNQILISLLSFAQP